MPEMPPIQPAPVEVFGPLWGVIPLAILVFTTWALVDAIRVPDSSMFRAGDRPIWVIVILFLGVVGPILYVAIGRPRLRRSVPS